VATEGIEGIYVETRNYGATAAFWKSLGFESRFETDHASGQWAHPGGGPYVFINERQDGELAYMGGRRNVRFERGWARRRGVDRAHRRGSR